MSITRRQLLAGAMTTAITGNLWSKEEAANDIAADGVLELRQYTLHGGQRDTLISMFETRFIEPQNALGAHVIGTFRDLDDPDRFVWIRGFHDMAMRQQALESFYREPVWQASKTAVNATILDSDNVLLLRPAGPDQGFALAQTAPHSVPEGIIGASTYYLGGTDAMQFARFFQQSMLPRLATAGAQPIACLVTEESLNTFPRLPVREHERTFVWFARWPSRAAEEAFVARWSTESGWRDAAPDAVLPALMRKPERLRLAPTQRSELR
jgi:NIPSNAP protein